MKTVSYKAGATRQELILRLPGEGVGDPVVVFAKREDVKVSREVGRCAVIVGAICQVADADVVVGLKRGYDFTPAGAALVCERSNSACEGGILFVALLAAEFSVRAHSYKNRRGSTTTRWTTAGAQAVEPEGISV